MPQFRDIGAVVLAGGKSSRFGKNKGLLRLGKKTIVERVVAEVKRFVDDVLIVADNADEYRFLDCPVHPDIHHGSALAGLHAGLSASRLPYNLVVAYDMPFLDAGLLEEMAPHVSAHDAVVFESDKGYESLFAVYSKSAVPIIEEMLVQEDLAIHNLYSKVRTKRLPAEKAYHRASPYCFFNINYEDDYHRALAIFEEIAGK